MVDVETLPWNDFLNRFQSRWRQGEHVAIIAPTGGGKTTLMRAILPLRKYHVFFGTKPDDRLYRQLLRDGFERVESFAEVKPYHDKVMLWPKQRDSIRSTYFAQHAAFTGALNRVVKQGGWTLWLDECKYMSEQLGMRGEITYALEQLRSIKGTTVSGAQRPVWLPRSVLSNSSHVFLWNTRDREDARRLADIGGIDAKQVASESQKLGKHEFIYIYTRGTASTLTKSQVGR